MLIGGPIVGLRHDMPVKDEDPSSMVDLKNKLLAACICSLRIILYCTIILILSHFLYDPYLPYDYKPPQWA